MSRTSKSAMAQEQASAELYWAIKTCPARELWRSRLMTVMIESVEVGGETLRVHLLVDGCPRFLAIELALPGEIYYRRRLASTDLAAPFLFRNLIVDIRGELAALGLTPGPATLRKALGRLYARELTRLGLALRARLPPDLE
jgi:hypothetical protein